MVHRYLLHIVFGDEMRSGVLKHFEKRPHGLIQELRKVVRRQNDIQMITQLLRRLQFRLILGMHVTQHLQMRLERLDRQHLRVQGRRRRPRGGRGVHAAAVGRRDDAGDAGGGEGHGEEGYVLRGGHGVDFLKTLLEMLFMRRRRRNALRY